MLTPEQVKQIKKIKDPLTKRRFAVYFQLPENIRRLFFDEKSADKMNAIARKNNLNENQLRWSSYIAGLVLLGETNIVDLVKTLGDKCRLTDEKAKQLARDINSAIFLSVKESLKKIHRVAEWPREGEAGQKTYPADNQRVVSLKEKEAPQPSVNTNNIVNLKEKR